MHRHFDYILISTFSTFLVMDGEAMMSLGDFCLCQSAPH